MRRSGVHLDAIRLAHVHVAVGGIHREVVEEVPAHDGLQTDEVLLRQISIFEIVLHVVDAPYALYLLAEEVAIYIARDEEVIVRVLCAQTHVVVLLRLQVLVTLNHEHAEVVPVEEQLLDAWRTVAHRVVGSPCPVIRRTPLEGNLRHRHQSEGTAEVGSHTCRNHPVVVHRPLVLQESLRLLQRTGAHDVGGIAVESVARQVIAQVLDTEDEVVALKLLRGDGEARLEDTALIHFGTLVDTLMSLEAVVEVAMKGGGNLEPILEGVLNLGSSRPVTRLTESHILNEVVGIHIERTTVGKNLQILERVVEYLLRYRDMLCTLDAHWRTGSHAGYGHVVVEPRIRLLGIYLLVVLRLVHVEGIARRIPHVGLRGHLASIESCRYPALQVRAVGVLLKHIQEVLLGRILVVGLVHLSPAYTSLNVDRLGSFLGDEVDDGTRRTASIEGTAGTFHDFDAVDGMEVETLIVEVTSHVARQSLTILQEEHVAGIQALHGDFVAEAHLLDVHTRCLLLQCLGQVGIACIHQFLTAEHLRAHWRELDRSGGTGTSNHHLVHLHHVFCHEELEGVAASDDSIQRVIAHGYHLVITLVTLRHRDGSLTIHVGNNTLWRFQFLVVGVGDDCADDWLLSGFVEDTELHLSLCSDREGEYQQQADEHYISNCLHLYCHSIFSKSLHDFSLAMACFSSLHFLLAKRKRDMSGHIPLSFYI